MTTWTINGKTPDQSFVFRSGLRMQVTPEGDCREATFMAKGAGLGLRPLDAVQIAYNGMPIFYGEVRVGGNPHDVDGHQYTLRSLALRLREVTIPPGWSAPQQAAHLTVRSLMNAVVGQLDGTVTIGTIQDLGFNARAIKNANQQNPYALLEQIVADGAGMGVKVRFGVNANREFFCVRAREDVAALTNDMLTGATRFTAPVAETPCTAVLWYVTKRQDGSWVTHLSEAPEVAVYGRRVKPIGLTSDDGLWEVADMTLSPSAGVSVDTWTLEKDSSGGIITSHDLNLVKGRLTNGVGLAEYTSARLYLNEGQDGSEVALNVTTDAQRLVVVSQHGFVGTVTVRSGPNEYELPDRRDTWAVLTVNGQEVMQLPSGTSFQYVGPINTAKLSLNLAARPSIRWSANLWLFEFRPERLNTALLDRLARFHYNIPASAPADIELREFRPPSACAGYVTLNGWQSPVEAWEYRLSADRGMTVGVLAGQADDPNKLAQAELIKARDGRAVITALASRS